MIHTCEFNSHLRFWDFSLNLHMTSNLQFFLLSFKILKSFKKIYSLFKDY